MIVKFSWMKKFYITFQCACSLLCVCLCMCTYVCMCMWLCVYVSVCVYMYICVCIHRHVKHHKTFTLYTMYSGIFLFLIFFKYWFTIPYPCPFSANNGITRSSSHKINQQFLIVSFVGVLCHCCFCYCFLYVSKNH